MNENGAITPWLMSCGAPYIDTEDPRCEPRPVTAPGEGSFVKAVDRKGEHGENMTVGGTIGIQNDKAQVHNLDVIGLVAIRSLDDASDTGEDVAEEPSVVGRLRTVGVDPMGRVITRCRGACLMLTTRARMTSRTRHYVLALVLLITA